MMKEVVGWVDHNSEIDIKLKMLITVFISLLIILLIISPAMGQINEGSKVYSVTIDGVIDGGTANYVLGAISRAEDEESPLIIKINTPGGLINPTKEIVDEILTSDVTIVCWVTPDGGWAQSAGAFITMAGDIAIMDTGTTIGSAEPRPAENKTIQAMASWMKEIAETQGRPGNEARKFVTENMNIGAQEALDKDLIDYITGEESEVLQILEESGSPIQGLEKGVIDEMISILTNPTVAFLLLLVGVLGLITEVTTGGVGVPGVAGGIALILAFFGLSILELSTTGIILIILGIVLIIAEYFEPGFGVFGIGGGIALLLGILLVGDEPYFEVSSWVLIALAVIIIGISLFVIWSVTKAQKREVETGIEKLKNVEGRVTRRLDPDGVVKVRGERWNATSKESIDEGENIVVKDIIEKDGQTTLLVEKVKKGEG